MVMEMTQLRVGKFRDSIGRPSRRPSSRLVHLSRRNLGTTLKFAKEKAAKLSPVYLLILK